MEHRFQRRPRLPADTDPVAGLIRQTTDPRRAFATLPAPRFSAVG